jgi:hypothetical protein
VATKAEASFILWEVVAWRWTGAATPAPGHDAILLWPRDKHDYNRATTTSQEGGAVPEARPMVPRFGGCRFAFLFSASNIPQNINSCVNNDVKLE